MRIFRVITLSCLSILTLFPSCSQLGEKEKGQLILSSRFDFNMATLSGYNFESAAYVSFPSTEEILPDIVLTQYRLLDGSIKPGFSSPSNINGFALAGGFDELEASTSFFENALSSVDTMLSFKPDSDTVELYQVWIMKTALDNFVKLHVIDIIEIEDASGKHNELTIDYYYQPDGTPIFPS